MSTDRLLLKRLAVALDAVADGTPLVAALEAAGIDAGQARRLMAELASHLVNDPAHPPAEDTSPAGTLAEAVAYSDGGSRGNPGEAACAVVVFDASGDELLRRAKRLGTATNNQAEYEGVILALELAGQLGAKKLEIRLDSELVVRQLEGAYKVKNEGLKPYYQRACRMLDGFQVVTVNHIPRAQNKLADKLVNAALDGKELPED
jgi:ribonuclease HI